MANRPGLSLIELLIGLAIVGLMLAAIMPFFQQREPGYERKQFVARLNAMMYAAWQQSVITHTVHRIIFNFKDRTALLEKFDAEKTKGSDLQFSPVKVAGGDLSWPKSLSIRQFIVEGFDELQRRANTQTAWFYVIPDGMAQQVTINGIDKQQIVGDKPALFGLVLNPYMAQFRAYDTHQK